MSTTIEDLVQEIARVEATEVVEANDGEYCCSDDVAEIVRDVLSDRLSDALEELDHPTSDDVISRIENHESDEPHLSEDDVQKLIDARLSNICGTIADTLAERLRQQLVSFMLDAMESEIKPGDRPGLDVEA